MEGGTDVRGDLLHVLVGVDRRHLALLLLKRRKMACVRADSLSCTARIRPQTTKSRSKTRLGLSSYTPPVPIDRRKSKSKSQHATPLTTSSVPMGQAEEHPSYTPCTTLNQGKKGQPTPPTCLA